jgi:hypothetical protein
MSIDQQAQKAIAAADPQLVAALLAACTPADDLIPRGNWLSLTSSEVKKLPSDLSAREARLQILVTESAAKLEVEKRAYERYRIEGLRALSSYDIAIASGGDAAAALAMALRFLSAHVTYTLSFVMRFQLLLDEVSDERTQAASHQLDLFA